MPAGPRKPVDRHNCRVYWPTRDVALGLARLCPPGRILSTQRIPRDRDRILSTQRIPENAGFEVHKFKNEGDDMRKSDDFKRGILSSVCRMLGAQILKLGG